MVYKSNYISLCCSLRASLACSGCSIMGMLPRLKQFILLCSLSRALCICHHCLPSVTGTMARKLSATAWARCSEAVTYLGCSLAIEWIALPTHQQCMPFTRSCKNWPPSPHFARVVLGCSVCITRLLHPATIGLFSYNTHLHEVHLS